MEPEVLDAIIQANFNAHFRIIRYLVLDELTAPPSAQLGDMLEVIEPRPIGQPAIHS